MNNIREVVHEVLASLVKRQKSEAMSPLLQIIITEKYFSYNHQVYSHFEVLCESRVWDIGSGSNTWIQDQNSSGPISTDITRESFDTGLTHLSPCWFVFKAIGELFQSINFQDSRPPFDIHILKPQDRRIHMVGPNILKKLSKIARLNSNRDNKLGVVAGGCAVAWFNLTKPLSFIKWKSSKWNTLVFGMPSFVYLKLQLKQKRNWMNEFFCKRNICRTFDTNGDMGT